jgi:pyruvate dehydrogenase E1 component
LNPQEKIIPYVKNCFGDKTPTIAVSDHISAVPEMIQRWVGGHFIVLGTDGYGRSDTRESLREFFEIDTNNIVLGAISALENDEKLPNGSVENAIKILNIKTNIIDKTK